MTVQEKLQILKTKILPDTETDEVLSDIIQAAESQILNRMYPFGYDDLVSVPRRYEQLQLQLAVELYTKRGAEGQASHTENGTTRTWSTTSPLLNQIVPHVGSVMANA